MKRFIPVMFLAVAGFPAVAGLSSGWSSGSVIVVAEPQPKSVAVSLVMPADFVSVPVRIISEQKNTALAYEETRQGIELRQPTLVAAGLFC